MAIVDSMNLDEDVASDIMSSVINSDSGSLADSQSELDSESESESESISESSLESLSDSEEEEEIEGADVIVIQPGSLNIRIGLASDPYPQIHPNCIARLRRGPLPPQDAPMEDDPNQYEEYQAGLEDMEHYIKKLRGGKRSKNAFIQCSSFNGNAKYTEIPLMNDVDHFEWTDVSHRPPYVCGKEALTIDPAEPYELIWPIRRGQFDISTGKTLHSILSDISTIWEHYIVRHLGVDKSKFKSKKVLLIVPDLHDRQHITELVNVLLRDLGFHACIMHHTAVCAAVGAGISSACVIDLGDQKTSICCVDDGMVVPQTRVHLPYGGDDIGRLLLWLMQEQRFPYVECNLGNTLDRMLIRKMKEDLCHLLLDEVAIFGHDFTVRRPNQTTKVYSIKLYEEVLRAPLGLFFPRCFALKPADGYFISENDYQDPTDICEDVLLSEADQSSMLMISLNANKAANEEPPLEDAASAKPDPQEEDASTNAAPVDSSSAGATSRPEIAAPSADPHSAVVNRHCGWDDCSYSSSDYALLLDHCVVNHVGVGKKEYDCKWSKCPRRDKCFVFRTHVLSHMKTHVKVLFKPEPPLVPLPKNPSLPSPGTPNPVGGEDIPYPCRWTSCSLICESISQLWEHAIRDHIGFGKSRYICEWQDCIRQLRAFPLRPHVVTHMRTHIAEKAGPKGKSTRAVITNPAAPPSGLESGFADTITELRKSTKKLAEKILHAQLAAQRVNLKLSSEEKANQKPAPAPTKCNKFQKISPEDPDSSALLNPLPLHEAVNFSISQCDHVDLEKRMYSNILVVGGTHLIRGLIPVLEYRINLEIDLEKKKLLDGIEVLSNPKGVDPLILSWKGASVISRLEIVKEQWIRQGEWQKKGVRLLRERNPFVW